MITLNLVAYIYKDVHYFVINDGDGDPWLLVVRSGMLYFFYKSLVS